MACRAILSTTTTTTATMTTTSNNNGSHQPLLTPTSVALSLSPPRMPPHGSILRSLYTHPAATWRYLHRRQKNGSSDGDTRSTRRDASSSWLLLRLLSKKLSTSSSFAPFLHHLRHAPQHHHPHPHLPNSLSLPDQMTRWLGAILPLQTQHAFRDNGHFRFVADSLVTATCPWMGLGHWNEVRDFVHLSHSHNVAREDDVDDDDVAGLSSAKNEKGNYMTTTNIVVDAAAEDVTNHHEFNLAQNNRQGNKRKRKWTRRRIPYGDLSSVQFIDLYLPTSLEMVADTKSNDRNKSSNNNKRSNSNSSTNNEQQPQFKIPIRGTIFFVHGGAWGSGKPWMYRLIAPTFLRLNFAVVIVGYRTYPTAATIHDQVGDVMLAWEKTGDVLKKCVARESSIISCRTRNDAPKAGRENDDHGDWVGNVIMGHSSGAHVALLMLIKWIEQQQRQRMDYSLTTSLSRNVDSSIVTYSWEPNYFIGLSGPYDINNHFDYEAGRGVEQISPMKPICGHSRESFHEASPVKRFLSLFHGPRDDGYYLRSIQQLTPPILLVHGIEDATVPFTATADAGRILRSCGLQGCDEIYIDEIGHQDVIVHFMFGGVAKDLVLEWLFRCCSDGRERSAVKILSRM